MPPHKAEALRALYQVAAVLKGAEPIEELARLQLATTVQYAIQEVLALEELKRARRGPKAAGPA